MKRNTFTPVHIIPRISDIGEYAFINTYGIEAVLDIECEWMINCYNTMLRYGYTDTDYAYMLYEYKARYLEYIRVDMSIYSYIMEGWC